MPSFKPTPSNTNVIVSRLFTIQFQKVVPGGGGLTITLQSATQFVQPGLGYDVDIAHDGVRIAGTVTKITLSNETFADGAGFGAREALFVEVG